MFHVINEYPPQYNTDPSYTRIEDKLRSYDRVAAAERARRLQRHTVEMTFGQGCKCSYDHQSDGGEYAALIELRDKRHRNSGVNGATLEGGDIAGLLEDSCKRYSEESDDDDDSDDEFDYLLDEDLPVGDEQRRLQELEDIALYNAALEQHGYGVHRQMHPSRALRAAVRSNLSGACSPTVVHLFDANSRQCAEMDLALEKISTKYRGTRFLRAEGRAVILMDADTAGHFGLRLESDVPSIMVFKDGILSQPPKKVSDFGDRSGDVIISHVLEQWLSHSGVLQYNPPRMDDLCRIRPEEEVMMDMFAGLCGEIKTQEVVEEEFYNCGLAGCSKKFAHEHVGVKTSEQSGLVVLPENEEVALKQTV